MFFVLFQDLSSSRIYGKPNDALIDKSNSFEHSAHQDMDTTNPASKFDKYEMRYYIYIYQMKFELKM